MYSQLKFNGKIDESQITHKWGKEITSNLGSMLIIDLHSKKEVEELANLIKNVTKNSGFTETDCSCSVREYTESGETIALYIHYKDPLKYTPPRHHN